MHIYNLRWIVRIISIMILLIGLVWIIDQNVSFRGYKKIEYAFGDPGPIISELQPVSRLGPKEYDLDNRSYQKMYEDPVYFDLITPVSYRRGEITLYFRNVTSIPLQIGVRPVGQPEYVLQDVTHQTQEHGWTVARVAIDLSTARYEGGKYRFVFSVPGLVRGNPNEYIALSSIVLELYKEPIYLADLPSFFGKALPLLFR